ncbi:hypothetical protein FRC14_005911 [Serendipita sp. 396]|nr:hypothetical protein FRC14_005911 [Serendipita sp. 396]
MSTPYHRYLFVFVLCASVYFLILYTPDKGGNLFTVEDLGGTEMAQEGRLGQQNYTRTIVGIGDLHGDLPNALKVLKMTNVIDDDNNWSGKIGKKHVEGVSTTADDYSGDDTIALYKLMEKLREQAPRKGGLFLSTLGNHEVMNAIDFPYLTPYPSSINSIGRSLLHKLQTRPQPPPHPPNPYPGLPASATVAEQYLYDGNGPLWYRGWATENENEACKKIDDVLKRTGTRRLVMGHTPTFTNVVSRCNGKVIIIDTGISHAYGGVLSGLSITYSLSPATPEPMAKHQQRWVETEKVAAVYEQTTKVLVEETRELVGDYGVY